MNQSDKISKLIKNFFDINNILKNEKDEQFIKKYYHTIKYIYLKEIKKVNNPVYRSAILGELIKEKEILKISSDIFQIILNSYMNVKDYKYVKDDLLVSKNDAIKLIDKNLSDDKKDYYLTLSETITYYFENSSLIYLKSFTKIESFGKEPLEIFKGCNDFLYKFKSNLIKAHGKLTYIMKLFCIGYIKSYCYKFIKMHDKPKFNPENIIKAINESDKINMVKLYIYKIIYNKNNKKINVFFNNAIKDKYKLDQYNNFKDFIKSEDEVQFNYEKDKSNNENYKEICKKLEDFLKDEFESEITKEDISSSGKVIFDDFYMAACDLILSNLYKKDFENENVYTNFYKNVCEPLYKKGDEDDENNKLIILLQFLFEKDKYIEIKKEYGIKPEDIGALLYGYRYCLNEISEEFKEGDYIYTSLYYSFNSNYLDEKLYPGSDNKEEPYYELNNKIENHFKEKPNEGCYVCLCSKGYYHSVSSGFPDSSEINIKSQIVEKKLVQ